MMDPERRKLLNYFFRVEEDNSRKKDRTEDSKNHIAQFNEEYLGAESLFEIDFGMPLRDFCCELQKLMDLITDRMKAIEKLLPTLLNGNIDILSSRTFLITLRGYVFKKSQLLENLD
ncbi:hypothetical protein [Nitrosomonas communis]|uniref:Uncharacterized protein n=1 Tax=Nitrosomonas communis TaxID=44574 RepID=A0A1H2XEV2_9PROT|nr:hypothetical protein [Nitrosomonas communis]SDW90994.1 hypothetical protein SAMN05421882_103726 [Nitrosomonas communis]